MKHVNAIREEINQGQIESAYDDLDNVLALGPSNTEALKLQAMLLSAEGRFREEAKIWNRILEIDNEDEDAIHFYQSQQLEDRELFYFTEDLPLGGRRYLAYPRAVFTTTGLALFGTLCYWFLQTKIPAIQQKFSIAESYTIPMVIGIFVLTVCIPMLFWAYHFVTSLKYIDLTEKSLVVKSQFRTVDLPWDKVKHACLRYGKDPNNPDLRLSIISKDPQIPSILIDMNEESSSVRARTYLLTELERYIEDFTNVREDLVPENASPLRQY